MRFCYNVEDIDDYGGYDDLFIVQKGWVSMSGLSKLKGLWKRRIAVLIAAVLIFEGTILPVSAATLQSNTNNENQSGIAWVENVADKVMNSGVSANALSGNSVSENVRDTLSGNALDSEHSFLLL